MKRILLLCVFSLCCTFVLPQNVLLLVSDDQGLDASCYGNPLIKTSNLDHLAQEGVRFTNAFATVASCSASRSVILTGLYNHTNGQFGHAHDFHNLHTLPWVETLPQLLKKKGYATGVIGKLHVNPESQYAFDFSAQGAQIGGNRDVAAMARKAGEFFRKNQNSPFFLLVGYSDPHRAAKGFANDRDYSGVEKVVYDPAKIPVPPYLPDAPEVREELADHFQAVSRLDQGIGLVLKELEAAGKAQETLVIYVSDNGIPFPGAKTNLYDAGIHLPMLMRSPKQTKRGLVNHAMVSWIDIVPTILDWTRAAGPSYSLPGRSILPILERENPQGWDEVYVSHTFHEITMYYPSRGMRTRKFKYLLNLFHELEFPHASDLYNSPTWQTIVKRGDKMMGQRPVKAYLFRPAEELYDLEKDPNEIQNVAGDPKYADVLREVRQRVRLFRERTKDPWLQITRSTEHH